MTKGRRGDIIIKSLARETVSRKSQRKRIWKEKSCGNSGKVFQKNLKKGLTKTKKHDIIDKLFERGQTSEKIRNRKDDD